MGAGGIIHGFTFPPNPNPNTRLVVGAHEDVEALEQLLKLVELDRATVIVVERPTHGCVYIYISLSEFGDKTEEVPIPMSEKETKTVAANPEGVGGRHGSTCGPWRGP